MPSDMKPITASARRLADDLQPVRSVALRTIHDVSQHQVPGNGIATQPPKQQEPGKQQELAVNLTVALVAISNDTPMVMTTSRAGMDALPSARFHWDGSTSLETTLRDGVSEQTGSELGHAEQLQTFAERTNGLAVGYLALTRPANGTMADAAWHDWYEYLPWEDWRNGRPAVLPSIIEPGLRAWAERSPPCANDSSRSLARSDLIRLAFGFDRVPWNEERVIDRFNILSDAGMLGAAILPGRAMHFEHLRVLANAIGRLRTRLKVRPLVFELMDEEFTLFELQKTVEAVLGPHLHKQNFRRLVESAGLVEVTGEVRSKTGGRPAKLFRFRREVLMERPAPGFRVHAQRM